VISTDGADAKLKVAAAFAPMVLLKSSERPWGPPRKSHRTYYSGIERGVRNVSLMNIEKVSKGLKTSLTDLFGRI